MSSLYVLTKSELKEKKASDFREGDIIACNKYRIEIKYGNFTRANMMTTVYTQDDIRSLAMYKQPNCRREFIDKW